MDGIVIVDKPTGWTSQDVVARLRGVYQTRRIGSESAEPDQADAVRRGKSHGRGIRIVPNEIISRGILAAGFPQKENRLP